MKNKLFYLLLTLAITGCQPEAYKELGEVRNVVQSLSGTWKLSKVTQRDEDAIRKGFPFRELDLTTLFPYTDFSLTLNTDAAGATTYSSQQGNAPQILKSASGNWSVDHPLYPAVLAMQSGAVSDSIRLGAYPVGAQNKLSLTVQRKENDKLVLSYIYEFTKQ